MQRFQKNKYKQVRNRSVYIFQHPISLSQSQEKYFKMRIKTKA